MSYTLISKKLKRFMAGLLSVAMLLGNVTDLSVTAAYATENMVASASDASTTKVVEGTTDVEVTLTQEEIEKALTSIDTLELDVKKMPFDAATRADIFTTISSLLDKSDDEAPGYTLVAQESEGSTMYAVLAKQVAPEGMSQEDITPDTKVVTRIEFIGINGQNSTELSYKLKITGASADMYEAYMTTYEIAADDEAVIETQEPVVVETTEAAPVLETTAAETSAIEETETTAAEITVETSTEEETEVETTIAESAEETEAKTEAETAAETEAKTEAETAEVVEKETEPVQATDDTTYDEDGVLGDGAVIDDVTSTISVNDDDIDLTTLSDRFTVTDTQELTDENLAALSGKTEEEAAETDDTKNNILKSFLKMYALESSDTTSDISYEMIVAPQTLSLLSARTGGIAPLSAGTNNPAEVAEQYYGAGGSNPTVVQTMTTEFYDKVDGTAITGTTIPMYNLGSTSMKVTYKMLGEAALPKVVYEGDGNLSLFDTFDLVTITLSGIPDWIDVTCPTTGVDLVKNGDGTYSVGFQNVKAGTGSTFWLNFTAKTDNAGKLQPIGQSTEFKAEDQLKLDAYFYAVDRTKEEGSGGYKLLPGYHQANKFNTNDKTLEIQSKEDWAILKNNNKWSAAEGGYIGTEAEGGKDQDGQWALDGSYATIRYWIQTGLKQSDGTPATNPNQLYSTPGRGALDKFVVTDTIDNITGADGNSYGGVIYKVTYDDGTDITSGLSGLNTNTVTITSSNTSGSAKGDNTAADGSGNPMGYYVYARYPVAAITVMKDDATLNKSTNFPVTNHATLDWSLTSVDAAHDVSGEATFKRDINIRNIVDKNTINVTKYVTYAGDQKPKFDAAFVAAAQANGYAWGGTANPVTFQIQAKRNTDPDTAWANYDATLNGHNITGGTFTITGEDGGTATLLVQNDLMYRIKEVSAPSGLTPADTDWHEIVFAPTERSKAIDFTNSATISKYSFKKTTAGGAPIAGVEFKLTKAGKTYTATSGTDGIVTFFPIEAGTYTLSETPDPKYQTAESKSVTITANSTYVDTNIVNHSNAANLHANKYLIDYDASGNKIRKKIPNSTPFEGKFKLQYDDGSGWKDYQTGNPATTVTVGLNNSTTSTTGFKFDGLPVYAKDGSGNYTKAIAYRIVETVPTGYSGGPTITTPEFTLVGYEDGKTKSDIDMENQKPATLQITTNLSTLNENGGKVTTAYNKAKYELYTSTDGVTFTKVPAASYTLTESDTSNVTTFEGLPVIDGTGARIKYYVKQINLGDINANVGLSTNNDYEMFYKGGSDYGIKQDAASAFGGPYELTTSDAITDTVWDVEQARIVKVVKVDLTTATYDGSIVTGGTAITGAEVTVKNGASELYTNLATGDGKKAPQGALTATETKAPAGYVLNSTAVNIPAMNTATDKNTAGMDRVTYTGAVTTTTVYIADAPYQKITLQKNIDGAATDANNISFDVYTDAACTTRAKDDAGNDITIQGNTGYSIKAGTYYFAEQWNKNLTADPAADTTYNANTAASLPVTKKTIGTSTRAVYGPYTVDAVTGAANKFKTLNDTPIINYGTTIVQKFIKKDATVSPDTFLPGAKISIEAYTAAGKGGTKYNVNPSEVTTGADGSVSVRLPVYAEDGTTKLYYTFEEKEAPSGYTKNGATWSGNITDVQYTISTTPAALTVADKPQVQRRIHKLVVDEWAKKLDPTADPSTYTTDMGGAEFALYRWDATGNQWIWVENKTTSGNGLAAWGGLDVDAKYMAVEIGGDGGVRDKKGDIIVNLPKKYTSDTKDDQGNVIETVSPIPTSMITEDGTSADGNNYVTSIFNVSTEKDLINTVTNNKPWVQFHVTKVADYKRTTTDGVSTVTQKNPVDVKGLSGAKFTLYKSAVRMSTDGNKYTIGEDGTATLDLTGVDDDGNPKWTEVNSYMTGTAYQPDGVTVIDGAFDTERLDYGYVYVMVEEYSQPYYSIIPSTKYTIYTPLPKNAYEIKPATVDNRENIPEITGASDTIGSYNVVPYAVNEIDEEKVSNIDGKGDMEGGGPGEIYYGLLKFNKWTYTDPGADMWNPKAPEVIGNSGTIYHSITRDSTLEAATTTKQLPDVVFNMVLCDKDGNPILVNNDPNQMIVAEKLSTGKGNLALSADTKGLAISSVINASVYSYRYDDGDDTNGMENPYWGQFTDSLIGKYVRAYHPECFDDGANNPITVDMIDEARRTIFTGPEYSQIPAGQTLTAGYTYYTLKQDGSDKIYRTWKAVTGQVVPADTGKTFDAENANDMSNYNFYNMTSTDRTAHLALVEVSAPGKTLMYPDPIPVDVVMKKAGLDDYYNQNWLKDNTNDDFYWMTKDDDDEHSQIVDSASTLTFVKVKNFGYVPKYDSNDYQNGRTNVKPLDGILKIQYKNAAGTWVEYNYLATAAAPYNTLQFGEDGELIIGLPSDLVPGDGGTKYRIYLVDDATDPTPEYQKIYNGKDNDGTVITGNNKYYYDFTIGSETDDKDISLYNPIKPNISVQKKGIGVTEYTGDLYISAIPKDTPSASPATMYTATVSDAGKGVISTDISFPGHVGTGLHLGSGKYTLGEELSVGANTSDAYFSEYNDVNKVYVVGYEKTYWVNDHGQTQIGDKYLKIRKKTTDTEHGETYLDIDKQGVTTTTQILKNPSSINLTLDKKYSPEPENDTQKAALYAATTFDIYYLKYDIDKNGDGSWKYNSDGTPKYKVGVGDKPAPTAFTATTKVASAVHPDADGMIKIENGDPGWYYIVETACPTGYNIKPAEIVSCQGSINGGTVFNYTKEWVNGGDPLITISKTLDFGGLLIDKDNTNEVKYYSGTKPVPALKAPSTYSVKFKVWKKSESTTTPGTYIYTDTGKTLTATLASPTDDTATGQFILKGSVAVNLLTGTDEYVVQEVLPITDDMRWFLQGGFTGKDATGNDVPNLIKLDTGLDFTQYTSDGFTGSVTNKAGIGTLEIHKTFQGDEVTDKSGVEFAIYDADVSEMDETTAETHRIGSVKTNADGYARYTFDLGADANGDGKPDAKKQIWYREMNTISGYIQDPAVYSVVFSEYGQKQSGSTEGSTDFVNRKGSTLTLYKYTYEDGAVTTTPIPDATFTLYRRERQTVGSSPQPWSAWSKYDEQTTKLSDDETSASLIMGDGAEGGIDFDGYSYHLVNDDGTLGDLVTIEYEYAMVENDFPASSEFYKYRLFQIQIGDKNSTNTLAQFDKTKLNGDTATTDEIKKALEGAYELSNDDFHTGNSYTLTASNIPATKTMLRKDNINGGANRSAEFTTYQYKSDAATMPETDEYVFSATTSDATTGEASLSFEPGYTYIVKETKAIGAGAGIIQADSRVVWKKKVVVSDNGFIAVYNWNNQGNKFEENTVAAESTGGTSPLVYKNLDITDKNEISKEVGTTTDITAATPYPTIDTLLISNEENNIERKVAYTIHAAEGDKLTNTLPLDAYTISDSGLRFISDFNPITQKQETFKPEDTVDSYSITYFEVPMKLTYTMGNMGEYYNFKDDQIAKTGDVLTNLVATVKLTYADGTTEEYKIKPSDSVAQGGVAGDPYKFDISLITGHTLSKAGKKVSSVDISYEDTALKAATGFALGTDVTWTESCEIPVRATVYPQNVTGKDGSDLRTVQYVDNIAKSNLIYREWTDEANISDTTKDHPVESEARIEVAKRIVPTVTMGKEIVDDGVNTYKTGYFASTDTSVDTSKKYYTKSTSSSGDDIYTAVAAPTGNPSTQGYYEHKTWNSTTTPEYKITINNVATDANAKFVQPVVVDAMSNGQTVTIKNLKVKDFTIYVPASNATFYQAGGTAEAIDGKNYTKLDLQDAVDAGWVEFNTSSNLQQFSIKFSGEGSGSIGTSSLMPGESIIITYKPSLDTSRTGDKATNGAFVTSAERYPVDGFVNPNRYGATFHDSSSLGQEYWPTTILPPEVSVGQAKYGVENRKYGFIYAGVSADVDNHQAFIGSAIGVKGDMDSDYASYSDDTYSWLADVAGAASNGGTAKYKMNVQSYADDERTLTSIRTVNTLPTVNDYNIMSGMANKSAFSLTGNKLTDVYLENTSIETITLANGKVLAPGDKLYLSGTDFKVFTSDKLPAGDTDGQITNASTVDKSFLQSYLNYDKTNADLTTGGWTEKTVATDGKDTALDGCKSMAVEVNYEIPYGIEVKYDLECDVTKLDDAEHTDTDGAIDPKFEDARFKYAVESFNAGYKYIKKTETYGVGIEQKDLAHDASLVNLYLTPGTVSVGGHIWIDDNANGIEDPEEVLTGGTADQTDNANFSTYLQLFSVTLDTYRGTSEQTPATPGANVVQAGTNGQFKFEGLAASEPMADTTNYPLYDEATKKLNISSLKTKQPVNYYLNIDGIQWPIWSKTDISNQFAAGADGYKSLNPNWMAAYGTGANLYGPLNQTSNNAIDSNFSGTVINSTSENFFLWAKPTESDTIPDSDPWYADADGKGVTSNNWNGTENLGLVPYRKVTIRKYDQLRALLKGADFEVYGPYSYEKAKDVTDLSGKTPVQTGSTTSADDSYTDITFEDLLLRQEYIIVEKGVPANFNKDEATAVASNSDATPADAAPTDLDKITVKIGSDDYTAFVLPYGNAEDAMNRVEVTNKPDTSDIIINKIDNQTGERVAGAQFTLTRYKDADYANVDTTFVDIAGKIATDAYDYTWADMGIKDVAVDIKATDADAIEKLDEGAEIGTITFTVATDSDATPSNATTGGNTTWEVGAQVDFKGMPLGVYEAVEIKEPDGYVGVGGNIKLKFEVTTSNSHTVITAIDNSDDGIISIVSEDGKDDEITITNERADYKLLLDKQDIYGNKLSDIKFKIVGPGNYKSILGLFDWFTKDDRTQTIYRKTDADGQIDLGVLWGDYQITELNKAETDSGLDGVEDIYEPVKTFYIRVTKDGKFTFLSDVGATPANATKSDGTETPSVFGTDHDANPATAGTPSDADVTVVNTPSIGNIVMVKEDDKTGEQLIGAEFEIIGESADALAGIGVDPENSAWAAFVKNPWGNDITKIADGVRDGKYYMTFRMDAGKSTINNVPFGDYTITEIKAPNGYILNSVEGKAWTDSFTIDKDTRDDINYKDPSIFSNDLGAIKNAQHEMQIIKTDFGGTVLSGGATFTIQDTTNGYVILENGKSGIADTYAGYTADETLATQFTTGEDGKFILYKLPVGTYQLKEIKAPAGYDINKKIDTFEVTGEKNQEFSVKDYSSGGPGGDGGGNGGSIPGKPIPPTLNPTDGGGSSASNMAALYGLNPDGSPRGWMQLSGMPKTGEELRRVLLWIAVITSMFAMAAIFWKKRKTAEAEEQ